MADIAFARGYEIVSTSQTKYGLLNKSIEKCNVPEWKLFERKIFETFN